MPMLTTCTACKRQLQVPDEFLGRLVKCPVCGDTFTASNSAAPGPATAAPPLLPPLPPPEVSAPPPRTSADRPSAEDFEEGRLPRRPGADDAYEEGLPRRPGPGADAWDDDESLPRRRRVGAGAYDDDYPQRLRRGLGLRGLSSDYTIDMGMWFHVAKEHYSAVLGPMIGFMLIQFLIALVENIPVVGALISLVMLFINPALNAGYAIVSLAQLQGKRWTFGDFFGGFNWYGTLLGNFWLTVAMIFVCMLPTLVTLVVIAVLVDQTRNFDLFWLAFFVGIVNWIIAIYPVLRATCFSVQLIVDRDCGPVEAIQGSWQLSRGHFWGLFGVGLFLGLMVLAGFVACVVGLLFVTPLVVLIWNAGYLIITGSEPVRPRLSREEEGYYDDGPERR